MSSKEVIRAASMFTDKGVASRTPVVREIGVAMVVGLALGFAWQVRSAWLGSTFGLTPGSCEACSAPWRSLSLSLPRADVPLEREQEVG